MTKISPSIGRVVWYYPSGKSQAQSGSQPWAAHVAYVHGDTCVNLMVIDPNGVPHAKTSIRLVQEGEPLPDSPFCCWMPYQIGQAAKHTGEAVPLAAR